MERRGRWLQQGASGDTALTAWWVQQPPADAAVLAAPQLLSPNRRACAALYSSAAHANALWTLG